MIRDQKYFQCHLNFHAEHVLICYIIAKIYFNINTKNYILRLSKYIDFRFHIDEVGCFETKMSTIIIHILIF